MNTIIEKIRAEVNKLPEEYKGLYKQFGNSLGFIDGLDMVKKILSDLEKEEKPTNIDFEQELYKHFGQVKDFTLGLQIAKHFYELGCRRTAEKYDEIEYKRQRAEESEKQIEGLEEEIVKVCEDFVFPLYGLDDEFGRELINKIARHFAQWGAEHAKEQSKPKPIEGLDEESERLIETFDWGETNHLAEKELISATTRHFAKWDAEHLKK